MCTHTRDLPTREHRTAFQAVTIETSPVVTGVSALTLALAIGANTAVFSVVNGALLKPLPFEEPEQLVGVWHRAPAGPSQLPLPDAD